MIGAAGWMCLCASANPIEPLPQNRTSRIGGLRQERQGFRGIVELILAAEEMDSILCNSLPKRLLLAMALSRRKLRQRSSPGVRRRNQTGFCSKPLPADLLGSAERPLAEPLSAEGTEASLSSATESAIPRSA